jgi:hypothetical protein
VRLHSTGVVHIQLHGWKREGAVALPAGCAHFAASISCEVTNHPFYKSPLHSLVPTTIHLSNGDAFEYFEL